MRVTVRRSPPDAYDRQVNGVGDKWQRPVAQVATPDHSRSDLRHDVASPVSVNDERRLVCLVSTAVEIEFIDDAGGDALVVLAEEEQEAVRARCENVDH